LEKGADVNAICYFLDFETPLVNVIFFEYNKYLIPFLIVHGADVKSVNKFLSDPDHSSSQYLKSLFDEGDVDIVELLVKNGMNTSYVINSVNPIIKLEDSSLEMVVYLFKNSIPFEIKDSIGPLLGSMNRAVEIAFPGSKIRLDRTNSGGLLPKVYLSTGKIEEIIKFINSNFDSLEVLKYLVKNRFDFSKAILEFGVLINNIPLLRYYIDLHQSETYRKKAIQIIRDEILKYPGDDHDVIKKWLTTKILIDRIPDNIFPTNVPLEIIQNISKRLGGTVHK
jgi:hypothetical protein